MKKPVSYQTKPAAAPIWVTEPFRVFLPLGIAASIFGVLIWPLFYAGLWPFSPPLQHPRLMVFGFGFAFVAGFLGTAWPKFLEAEALRRTELALLVAIWLLTQILCGFNQIRAADAAFAVNALVLFAVLAVRLWKSEESLPPPGFLLAFGTIFAAFCVGMIWALFPGGLPPRIYLFTKLVLWQGFLLFPLMGVGSYLFARFFQVPGKRPPAANQRHRAIGVWLAAVVILVSFGIEAAGWIRTGNALRFAAILIWMFLAVPALWKGKAPSTRAWALRIAIGSIGASFLIRAFWPGPGYALEHLLFLSGFGLAMFLVGDRVALGHSDKLEDMPAKSRVWRWLVWLILLTMATRVSADMKTSILISHHIYAALLWAIVAGIFFANLRKVWWSDPGQE